MTRDSWRSERSVSCTSRANDGLTCAKVTRGAGARVGLEVGGAVAGAKLRHGRLPRVGQAPLCVDGARRVAAFAGAGGGQVLARAGFAEERVGGVLEEAADALVQLKVPGAAVELRALVAGGGLAAIGATGIVADEGGLAALLQDLVGILVNAFGAALAADGVGGTFAARGLGLAHLVAGERSHLNTIRQVGQGELNQAQFVRAGVEIAHFDAVEAPDRGVLEGNAVAGSREGPKHRTVCMRLVL